MSNLRYQIVHCIDTDSTIYVQTDQIANLFAERLLMVLVESNKLNYKDTIHALIDELRGGKE